MRGGLMIIRIPIRIYPGSCWYFCRQKPLYKNNFFHSAVLVFGHLPVGWGYPNDIRLARQRVGLGRRLKKWKNKRSFLEAFKPAGPFFCPFFGLFPLNLDWNLLNLGVNDTPVFLLNEYIVGLNPANFNILNQILNWIFLKFLKLNNFLNLISLNWIMFWIEFCPKFSYWIFYWIEFCPKISYWIFYWTESGWKTENQLYFESILWYYTLKYPKNTPKCLIMP